MPMALTGDRDLFSHGLTCHWRSVSICFAVCSVGVKMCLLVVGRAGIPVNLGISLCVDVNGNRNIATRRSTNAPNVRTGSSSHWHTNIFTAILRDATLIVGTLSGFMQSQQMTVAISYAPILMTRVANMVIRTM